MDVYGMAKINKLNNKNKLDAITKAQIKYAKASHLWEPNPDEPP